MVVADTALREELADRVAAPLKPFSALDLQAVALILN
jgi:hypothetical protein